MGATRAKKAVLSRAKTRPEAKKKRAPKAETAPARKPRSKPAVAAKRKVAAKSKPAPKAKPKAKATPAPKARVTAKPAPKAKAKSKAKPKQSGRARRVAALEPARTTTAIHHEVDLPADPIVVWTCLVDPERHSAFTGGDATGAPRVGAPFTAWDGYIRGVHRELVRGERIVQSWSTSEWPDGAPPSRLEITLAKTRAGTRLTMMQTEVPFDQAAAYSEGWTAHYWEPLAAYLARGGA